MSIKNFLGSIIKKQIAIDVSNSGLLINNELLLEFSLSRLTEALGKSRITAITNEDISQVPNLKTIDGTAILMSEQVKNLCKSKGIVFVE